MIRATTPTARGRNARRGESAQSIVETAIILPLLLALACEFAGLAVLSIVHQRVVTAVNLATASAIAAPQGARCVAQGNAERTFDATLSRSVYYQARSTVHRTPAGRNDGVRCSFGSAGGVAYHAACGDGGSGFLEGRPNLRPVNCQATVMVDFGRTPIGWMWFGSQTITATSSEVPPPVRRCGDPTVPPSSLDCAP